MSKPFFAVRTIVFYCLVLILLCAVAGCSFRGGRTKPYRPAGPPSTQKKQAVALVPPLREYTVVQLSPTDKRHLISNWYGSIRDAAYWRDLDFALQQSHAHASRRPAGSVAFQRGGLNITYGEVAESVRHLQALLPRLKHKPDLLASEFVWYRIGPDHGITGYYEPTLKASKTQSKKYHYPIYSLPRDVRKGVPYHSRQAIDRKGALRGKGLELAYVTCEVDAFFLHIQGSGRLEYEDGRVTHVSYAGKNNQAYVPLGRVMRDRGLLEPDNISMQSIRRVLDDNPHLQPSLLDTNPSYVFFREADKGPLGSIGRPLTPWISIAVDRNSLPYGSLLFLATPLPDSSGSLTRPHYGIALPQDTGGAIKGNRIDLFCGAGKHAEHTAGYLDASGAVYILLKK